MGSDTYSVESFGLVPEEEKKYLNDIKNIIDAKIGLSLIVPDEAGLNQGQMTFFKPFGREVGGIWSFHGQGMNSGADVSLVLSSRPDKDRLIINYQGRIFDVEIDLNDFGEKINILFKKFENFVIEQGAVINICGIKGAILKNGICNVKGGNEVGNGNQESLGLKKIFKQIEDRGYKKVRRVTKKVQIFENGNYLMMYKFTLKNNSDIYVSTNGSTGYRNKIKYFSLYNQAALTSMLY